MARIPVTDAVWNEFRRATEGRPIAHVLAELVEREVAQDRARRVRRGRASDRELVDALADARALHEELIALVDRLEERQLRPSRQERLDDGWGE